VNSVSSRFAAVEQVSLVGTRGKLEAFAPSHGTKQDDESEVNFRRCLRSSKFIAEYEERARPPADLECGTIVEAHEKIDARLMQARLQSPEMSRDEPRRYRFG